MKKIISSALLVILSSFILSGCGFNSPTNTAPTAAPTSASSPSPIPTSVPNTNTYSY